MSICSIHKDKTKACNLCESMPWDIFNISKKDWKDGVDDASSEGLLTCPLCNFGGMFKKTCRQKNGRYMCPCCGKYFEL